VMARLAVLLEDRRNVFGKGLRWEGRYQGSGKYQHDRPQHTLFRHSHKVSPFSAP
jgi:hypothetical protein